MISRRLVLCESLNIRRRFRFLRFFAIACALAAVSPVAVVAHEDTLAQIARLDKRIAEERTGAELLLRRADLYRHHGDWDLALEDYRKALQFEPHLVAARLGSAECGLGQGDAEMGLREVGEILKATPDESRALLVRARLKILQGRFQEAAADYRRAVANLPEASAGFALYFEWASQMRKGGRQWYPVALEALDAGTRTLGDNIVLRELAITIECESGNLEGALTRIEALPPDILRDSPRWLLRRADVLGQLGKSGEARAAYAEVLERVRALPSRRRNAAAHREIEKIALEGLERMGNRVQREDDDMAVDGPAETGVGDLTTLP